MKEMIMMTVLSAFAAVAFAESTLVGDGVADDTAAIQAMLDSGRSLVYLPPPKKEYLISKTLKIGSNTELKLDRFTRIRLAPNSNCPMIQNRDWYFGTNFNVVVSGGVWDFDRLHQEENNYLRRHAYKVAHPELEFYDPANIMPKWNLGVLMRFSGVRNFTAKDLTLRNPTTYGFVLNRAEQFVVEDITFDYSDVDAMSPSNMDGVHLDSNCRFGRIAHIRGTTFDDMVALNCNDWWDRGPITDIVIEDIYATGPAFRAVRLLSKTPEAPVKRIVIRDIRGKFYTDVVGFTRYWEGGNKRGLIDDVLVENVYASRVASPEVMNKARKARGDKGRARNPLFQFQGGLDVGRVVFRNIVREETDVPTATFWFNEPARVKEFVLRDVKMVNRTDKPMDFFDGKGKIVHPVFENVTFEGEWNKPDGLK